MFKIMLDIEQTFCYYISKEQMFEKLYANQLVKILRLLKLLYRYIPGGFKQWINVCSLKLIYLKTN